MKLQEYGRGRRARLALIGLLAVFLSPKAALAISADASDDSYARPIPSANAGVKRDLRVGSGAQFRSLIKFQLDHLPEGAQATSVSQAIMRLYCRKVNVAGTVQLVPLESDWNEVQLRSTAGLSFSTPVLSRDVTVADTNKFVLFDLTDLVRDWIENPDSNFGIAIEGVADSSVYVRFDSKDGKRFGQAPVLDIFMTGDGDDGLPGPQGPVGAPGAQGLRGPQGPQGPQGPIGLQGPVGPEGAPGAEGPEGLIGPTGPEGPQGLVGPQGPQGQAGLIGEVGEQGLQGPVGLPGPDGTDGPVGPEGPQGAQGPIGPAGPDGLDGPQGPQGPQGPDGLQGPEGPVGPAGLDGADGPQGPEGPVGLTGPQGSEGPVGLAGPDGVDGNPGPEGPQGPTGPEGAAGPAGPEGIAGPIGIEGPVGPEGPAGPTGAEGVVGIEGPVGPVGPVGPEGAAGPEGAVGIQGVVGPEGPVGPTGPEGPAGPQGPVGIEGPVGPVGPEGPQGPVGPEGIPGPIGGFGHITGSGRSDSPVLANAGNAGGNGVPRNSWGDLAASPSPVYGPVVTIDTTSVGANARAMVFLTTEAFVNDAFTQAMMGFEVRNSSNNVVWAVDDARALMLTPGQAATGPTNSPHLRQTSIAIVTLPTAGVYTFTAKYRVRYQSTNSSKEATFSNREFTVSMF